MPSTYTSNLGIELPADGELDGVWGDVVNENMDILDRAINGVLSLSLSGTTSTLTTSDGALSDGQYKLLLLTGSPSGTHTITLAPNDAQKIYFVRNTTAQSVIFTQGSGGNVTIATGDSGIIYANGAGAGAAIANLTDHFAMSSVNITGGSITGLSDLGLSSAGPFIDFAETDTTDKDARISLSAGTLVFDTRTDADVLVQENMRIASNGNVGIGTAADAATKLEVSSDTNPTAVFIAFISGTTMTVTGITSGALAVGDRVFSVGVEWNTVITAQLTGTTGASGTYTVNNSQTVSSTPGISMSSVASGKSVLRLTNTDTTEAAGQTTGAIEFFGSDASTPGAGVKGYMAVIAESDTPDSAMLFGTSDNTASTLAVERMRITSTGLVGIGTKSPTVALDVVGAGNFTGNVAIENANPNLSFKETDATDTDARIRLNAGDLLFETVTDAGAQVRENMRITSAGDLLVGKTSSNTSSVGCEMQPSGVVASTRDANVTAIFGRNTDDGQIVQFRQGGVNEGNISVSGTTVSYNGGHLSRWAQFPDNSRPELLKGTVMSNLDQMSNWNGEENEQLNCVQVSAVDGDANVAGVFVAWDSTDDGYNDILLAMTGDMVIRIAAGTTVQRGDLLMSAGDGTAKPQDDDIVRAKTIAKVTSTHVSHNYADGSYAVPCVLMAC